MTKSVFDEETPTVDEAALRRAQNQIVQSNAMLHAIFLTDERAKSLLALWEQAADRRVPVNATIQEYAAAEAVRAFVQTIKNQIKIAQKLL